jgi:hypothetical protein
LLLLELLDGEHQHLIHHAPHSTSLRVLGPQPMFEYLFDLGAVQRAFASSDVSVPKSSYSFDRARYIDHKGKDLQQGLEES